MILCNKCKSLFVGTVIANEPNGFRECDACGRYIDTDNLKQYVTLEEKTVDKPSEKPYIKRTGRLYQPFRR